jgi:ketosteroid isomerase-like protein
MNLPRIALLVLLLSAPALALQHPPAADAVAGVRAVWAAQQDAWNRGDLEAYMAGYWKSTDLTFFSNSDATHGWQATFDRYRARYQGGKNQMGKLDFPELETVVLGADAALVRGRWHLKMPDGKEYTGMTSVIFRRLPEGWRIVHDHSSTAPTS